MASKKGQDVLVDAIARLRSRGIDATATFIGDGADMDMLRRRAAELGIADHVEFEGARSRAYIYSRLKDFDIMCHPSRYEGFGLTVAEGMAAGLPLVLPEFDGPWEVAGRGEFCRSFRSGDPEACADALADVIARYPEALRLAARAAEYTARKYSVSRMVDEYIDYYTSH